MKWFQCWLVVFLLFTTSGCVTTEHSSKSVPQKHSLANLTQLEADRLFMRGRTQQHEVKQWFGQPNGFSKAGDFSYWNYTHSYHDQNTARSVLVILTVVFDKNLLVIDYDLQSNRYQKKE